MKNLSDICGIFSVSLTGGILFIFLFSAVGFVFGISVSAIYSILGLVCSLTALSFLMKKNNYSAKEIISANIFQLFFIFLFVYIAANVMDISWDGRSYHQICIIFLKDGWNTVWQSAVDFAKNTYDVPLIKRNLLWVQHYVKFSEIMGANVFSVTHFIETGKLINFLSIFVLFCCSMFTFGKPIFGKLNNFMKILFSFLIIFNPVVIQQMFTYYNDFLVYCWFMVLLFGFFNIETSEEIKKTDLFLIFASSVILCNIKLGGLFYTLLLLILYGIYNLIVKNKTKFILSLKMFLGVLTVVVITGINPYITNLKDGYNVFYPLAGSAKIDNITYNMPDAFQKQSLPQKFLYSTFSKSSNSIRAYRNIQIKIPFTCYEAEFNSFLYPDTRIGGFGCLWGGIMILSLFLLRYIKKEDNRENKIIALIFGILLISVLTNPFNWWARYVPQFWAVPVLIALLAFSNPKKKNLLIIFSMFCMLFNSAVIAAINWNYNLQVQNEIKTLLVNHNKNTEVYFPENEIWEISILQKLKEYNYNYRIINSQEYSKEANNYEDIPHTVNETIKWKKQ